MALDVSRWVAYAKARAASAVARGNRSLDRREAERAAERADKPWLRADRDAETPATSVDTASRVAPDPRPPEELAAEADREGARLELERRQQAAAQRLRAIREELGGDEVPPGP